MLIIMRCWILGMDFSLGSSRFSSINIWTSTFHKLFTFLYDYVQIRSTTCLHVYMKFVVTMSLPTMGCHSYEYPCSNFILIGEWCIIKQVLFWLIELWIRAFPWCCPEFDLRDHVTQLLILNCFSYTSSWCDFWMVLYCYIGCDWIISHCRMHTMENS